ncbi:MAG: type II toxin-antitoxin system HicB family antitoxin [Candidatus Sungbacteria bacterium]|uniref:Type II toxin-antitoxin system HicB family antitoxin n=1 Tax=Candidatus Sungiibacteriota bacterium TaxID=2750080 RepID=A0A9D6LQZ9_9BACT|nr:type II toxin-antitoxin system HicB family antitoxin [Candidatus Sungbacteria bacterium]
MRYAKFVIYKFATITTKEGKWHVARAIELGVVSQGRTVPQALENLKEAVALYLEDNPKAKRSASKKAPLVTTLELQHA